MNALVFIIAVRPGCAPSLALNIPNSVVLRSNAARFPARLWRDGAVYLTERLGADSWCALLTENFQSFVRLELADFASPGLVCMREQFFDGTRHAYDWYQTGNTVSQNEHRALEYAEDSVSAYGDLGAMCLPLSALLNLTLEMPDRGWADGANIELCLAARRSGLPVRLGATTIQITGI